ncbi:MAG: DNA glycosylase [Clostridiales bacterium]|nr:DNA glycosylase [Clostridiales bacterium]
MQYIEHDGFVEISSPEDFDPVKIFECGQCFRWNADENGVYRGVAHGCAARVWTENGSVFISGTMEDFQSIWYDYFDLGRDYASARAALSIDEYTRSAAEYGAGIRILRQDKWEALCSFIISQCNNIPRIKKIVETLCSCFGEPVELEGKTLYAFPNAEKVAALSEADLAPLHCGYRAPYILGAAKAVADGSLDLDALAQSDFNTALKALKTMNGIGDKVANCVILFGLCIPDAFPIDVWMKKALAAHYPKDFDPKVFGKNAGLAQQYIFYYARSGNV